MDRENKIKELEDKLNNPNTPQGEIKSLNNQLYEQKRLLKLEQIESFEKSNKTSVYGSDDYVGCSAGNYNFYYGYEETKCPIKSHRDEDDCYAKDCDKREWCFVVYKNDKEIIKWAESEFSYEKADCIERILIVGMCKFIKEHLNSNNLLTN